MTFPYNYSLYIEAKATTRFIELSTRGSICHYKPHLPGVQQSSTIQHAIIIVILPGRFYKQPVMFISICKHL